MLIAMYSGISGMTAHQTKLNVIGNNIANVNTYGFKSSRVTFSDVFYQNLQDSSAPTTNSGGLNSNQLGYGAKVSSIDVINTMSGGADTGRALDVYINGEGYLPVKGDDGTVKYTRVGNLKFDSSGNLTDANGNFVLGVQTDVNGISQLSADGTTDVSTLVPINIQPDELEKYTGIAIGVNGELTGIRQGDPGVTPASNTEWFKSAAITTTSNYNGTVTMTTKPSDAVTYTANAGVTGISATVTKNPDIYGPLTLTKTGTAAAPVYTLSGKDKSGKVVSYNEVSTGSKSFSVLSTTNTAAVPDIATVTITDTALANGTYEIGTVVADTMTVNASVYDKGGTLQNLSATWKKGDTSITLGDMTFTVDPAKFGAIGTTTDASVGTVGPGDGVSKTLAYITVAKFANADGLKENGSGYYLQSTNSGQAIVSKAGTNGTGNLRSSALEMSNVDLSKEFTDMIIAQRGFQANSRMITVSDTILEELINLKR